MRWSGNIRVCRILWLLLSHTWLSLIPGEITRFSVVLLPHVDILSAVQTEKTAAAQHTHSPTALQMSGHKHTTHTFWRRRTSLNWRSNGKKKITTQTLCLDSVCVCVCVHWSSDKELSLKICLHPAPISHTCGLYQPPKHQCPTVDQDVWSRVPPPPSDTDRAPQREKKEAFRAYSTVRDVNRLTTVTSDPEQEQRIQGDAGTVAVCKCFYWLSSRS